MQERFLHRLSVHPRSMEELMTTQTTLGELISTLYDRFMEMYGDEELASVATAAVINDLLSAPEEAQYLEQAA